MASEHRLTTYKLNDATWVERSEKDGQWHLLAEIVNILSELDPTYADRLAAAAEPLFNPNAQIHAAKEFE
jgi:hypothetical protein